MMDKRLYRDQKHNLTPETEAEGGLPAESPSDPTKVNDRLVSTTDPEAAVVRQGNTEARPRYKSHRKKRGMPLLVISKVALASDNGVSNATMIEKIDSPTRRTPLPCESLLSEPQPPRAHLLILCRQITEPFP